MTHARTYLHVAREENAEEDVDKNEEDDEAERDEEQLHGDTETHTTQSVGVTSTRRVWIS